MGCDIHLHIEVKVNDEWLHYANPSVERSYMLFTKMANVRRFDGWEIDIESLSDDRGLPENLSKITKIAYEYEEISAHNMGWLNSTEISELEEWCRIELREAREPANVSSCDLDHDLLKCYFMGHSFGSLHSDRTCFPISLEDVRFVFWFDN